MFRGRFSGQGVLNINETESERLKRFYTSEILFNW